MFGLATKFWSAYALGQKSDHALGCPFDTYLSLKSVQPIQRLLLDNEIVFTGSEPISRQRFDVSLPNLVT